MGWFCTSPQSISPSLLCYHHLSLFLHLCETFLIDVRLIFLFRTFWSSLSHLFVNVSAFWFFFLCATKREREREKTVVLNYNVDGSLWKKYVKFTLRAHLDKLLTKNGTASTFNALYISCFPGSRKVEVVAAVELPALSCNTPTPWTVKLVNCTIITPSCKTVMWSVWMCRWSRSGTSLKNGLARPLF